MAWQMACGNESGVIIGMAANGINGRKAAAIVMAWQRRRNGENVAKIKRVMKTWQAKQ